jgi:UDP-N-acetyl-D-glucosamine dehydrogenase
VKVRVGYRILMWILPPFKSAIQSIGRNCKEDALVLVETTVPPGTCEKIISPTLEKELSGRALRIDRYKLGHSYERVMPGPDYVNSIREYPRVFSAINAESEQAVENFLRTVIDTEKCELTKLESTNATEIAKVLENSYRAMNIAFIVEWSRFAEEAGVNLYEIINAIRVRASHSNLMYPGIGVGGYCLTKDPLLASWAQQSFFGSKRRLDYSVRGVSTNDQMPRYAFERLESVYGNIIDRSIVFLGVSYRGDVGDTRFTPVDLMFDNVSAKTDKLTLHDPFVLFWEEKNLPVKQSLDDALSNDPKVIIISAGHSIYKTEQSTKHTLSLQPCFIFDTVGILTEKQIAVFLQKHSISVLGRGDL